MTALAAAFVLSVPLFWGAALHHRGLHPALALAMGLSLGGLALAVTGAVLHAVPLPGWLGILLAAAAPLVVFLRTGRNREAREVPAAGARWGLVLLGIGLPLVLLYLWLNAIRPPMLVGAIFDWSAPARNGTGGFTLPHLLSGAWYALDASDLGWKWLWSVFSLLPLAALYGGLRGAGHARPWAATAVLGPLFAFSVLFWGSSGYPDLFLAGNVLLPVMLTRRRETAPLVWIPLAVLIWSGPLWAGWGAAALIAAGPLGEPRSPAARTALALAGLLLVTWIAGGAFAAERVPQTALYLARDAWNTARYGPLVYGAAAAALFYAGRAHGRIGAGALVLLAVLIIDVTGRPGATFDIALRLEGSRSLAAALVVLWGWAFATAPTAAQRAAKAEMRGLASSRPQARKAEPAA